MSWHAALTSTGASTNLAKSLDCGSGNSGSNPDHLIQPPDRPVMYSHRGEWPTGGFFCLTPVRAVPVPTHDGQVDSQLYGLLGG
jgi:hypothetical protein